MILFLLTFLTIYGSLHLYAYSRIAEAFSLPRKSILPLRLLLILATISPLLIRACERYGPDSLTNPLAWGGYCWMGFIFILVSALLPLDVLSIAISFLFPSCNQPAESRLIRSRFICAFALFFAVFATCYGFYEALSIRTDRITVTTHALPLRAKPVRILQLSDVHLGLIVREKRLGRMLKLVAEARPDILVSTGDLLDGRLSRRNERSAYAGVTSMLTAIPAPLGKYAVLGNHEYYAGLEQSLSVTRAAGFQVLRNQAVDLPNGMSICGSDDPAWKQTGQKSPPGAGETDLLASRPRQNFRLYLKHRPAVEAGTEGLFDLQLSGHTHHGQIFPFYLVTKLEYPLPSGTTRLRHGSMIHVSRGTGTWGPPIRFLAPPEITIIDVIPFGSPNKGL